MAESNGYRTSILVPLSRYRQLLQNQMATVENETKNQPRDVETTETMTSHVSEKRKRQPVSEKNDHGDKNGFEPTEPMNKKAKRVHKKQPDDTPKPGPEVASVEVEDQDKICRKLLHTIFFNSAGNVLIQNHILHAESNILDLLRFSVEETATKPVGFKDIRRALMQINVPKDFVSNRNGTDRKPNKRTNDSSLKTKTNISKWQTF